jgi:hypothetical protein
MVFSNGPSVHQTLLSSRLLFSNSSDTTRKGTVGSSDGIYQVNSSLCVVYQVLRRYAPMVPSVHPTMFFPFFSSRLQLGSLLQLNILNMSFLL